MRKRLPPRALVLVVFTTVAWLAAPAPLAAETPELGIDWGTSPAAAEEASDKPLHGSDWRKFSRRSRTVRLHEESWEHVLVFYEDRLIAQGYHRREVPESPRVGTVSDIVSYDNDYWMASALRSQFGAPDFEDVRTKTEYSQELGDPAKRAHRSVDWDLRGERFRWATDDGTVRYAVRYSLKGVRDHHVVRVKPGAEKHYHFFRIARAFRKAGIRVVRRFEKKSQKMVVAMVTSSGEVVRSEYETEGEKLVPVQPEKDQYTVSNCRIRDRDCRVTFHTYGGRVYRVDVDLSSSGRIGRRERGGFEKVGERVYEDFLWVNERLQKRLGEPAADTSISDWKGDRKERRIHNIPQGREAFWTVWYEPGDDVLVRHVISGEQSGSHWSVDHRITFRLHSVARAFAAESSWRAESRQIEKAKELRKKIKRDMNKPSDSGDEGAKGGETRPTGDPSESDSEEGSSSSEE